ncbi:MAG: hypothetical protein GDA53_07420 [Rhodobacteraceae bacterium]|nr:hypothetical protein [Paracoccaceae bacterium]
MTGKVVVLLDNTHGQAMVKDTCKAKSIVFAEFEALVQAEVKQMGKQRRTRLWDEFDDILDRIEHED